MTKRVVGWSVGVVALLALAWVCLLPQAADKVAIGPGRTLASWPLPTHRLGEREARVARNYGRLPLYFERNVGQTDRQVQYLARGNGYTLFLTPTEAVLSLVRSEPATPGKPEHTVAAAVHAHLNGANPSAATSADGELPGRSNYFVGRDASQWHTGLVQYAQVQYQDIYPGINLVYYGHQQQLEYDFVVQPGVDPTQIQLSYQGADRLRLNADGDLVLRTQAGDIIQRKPVVYQEVEGQRRLVDSHYTLNERQQLGFQLGDYDHDRELVIDPMLSYSTYLNGSKGSLPGGIAIDSSGAAYVTGTTSSLDFPTANAYQGSNTTTNAFVSKLSADGQSLVYSTYLGGSQLARGVAVAVDGAGSAYVVGSASGNDFPVYQAYQGSNSSSQPVAFLTKLAANGESLVYSTYLGGTGSDAAAGVAVDSSNSAYVVGNTASSDFPTQSPYQSALAGRQNGFLTKFSADGQSLVYSTYLGGSGTSATFIGDYATGVAVDGADTAYVVGTTDSSNFPLASAYQSTLKGPSDAFVTHFAADGQSLLYSTYLGGSGSTLFGDTGNAITVDGSGSAYVAGTTVSADFPTQSPYQASIHGTQDGFVTKLSADGQSLVYSTYLGGSGSDAALGIGLDGSDNAYIVGSTGSSDFPLQSALQSTNRANVTTGFVTALSADGQSLLYSTYLGGSGKVPEAVTAVAVDSSGNAYITGNTASSDFPTQNPIQTTVRGTESVFVSKLTAGDAPSLSFAFSPATITLGQKSTLLWSSANTTSCSASGAWSGLESSNGSLSVTPTAVGSQTYSISCSGPGGSVSGSATLTATAAAPTLSFTAGSATVTLGSPIKLSWTSYFTTGCVASGAWSGSLASSGSQTLTPASPGSLTYSLSCTGAGGSISHSISVTVKALAPLLHLALSPASIVQGKSTTLSWSGTHASACTASGNWSGSQATSGSLTLSPAAGSYSYNLTCTGAGGSVTQNGHLTVQPAKPVLTLSASPATVTVGQSSVLSWSSSNIYSCTASNAWSGAEPVSGSQTIIERATGTELYTLNCSGAGGSISRNVEVRVTH